MTAPHESAGSVGQRYRGLLGRGQAGWARCAECGRAHFYPREHCPYCLSDSVEVEPVPQTFRVRSFTHVYRPQRPVKSRLPVLIIAGEAEGVTIIAEGSGWDGATCAVGDAARLITSPDERTVPVFAPADNGSEG